MYRVRNISISSLHKRTGADRTGVSQKTRNSNQKLGTSAASIGLIVIVLSLGLSGCGSNSQAFSSAGSASAGLDLSPLAVDFGDVTVGNAVFRKISIVNHGTSTIDISQLSSSSSAFTVESGALPVRLPAGSTLTVQVRYDPASTTDSTGLLSVNAMTSGSKTISGTVKLHGKGSNSTASLSALTCASSSVVGPGTDSCTVSLSTIASSGGIVVNLTSNNNAVTVPSSLTVPGGTSSVKFSANASAVSSSQSATIKATQGSNFLSTSITVNPTTATSVPVTPSIGALSCGTSSFTGSGSTACTVSLTTAAPSGGLTVGLVSSSSAVGVPSSLTVASGATAASFTASVLSVSSSQTATLTANANSSSKSFALQLNAAVPGLTLSPTSLAFGNVSVGTSVSESVMLTSSGTMAVTINSDSISGTGFSVSGGSLPVTLNPGQATVLTVQFAPSATNTVTGQLTIASSASTATVGLSGTGTLVAPTVSGISCNSTSITGSLADLCTVNLSGSAPIGGVSVSLGSNSSLVTVPASVMVPAAASSATFTANIASVTTAQSATVTATTGTTSRSVSLQLNAATAALSVNASSVAFGNVVVNTATTQTVTLTSSGTAAVTVNSVAVTGSGFSASAVSLPATLNPGQVLTLTLTFDPTVVGSATGQLTISSNSATNSTITVGLTGTGTPHEVDLSWIAPSSSTDPIAGYNVYRAPGGTGSFALLNSVGTQTAYVDTSVQSGQSYDYVVKSVDSSGVESAPSNTSTVTIP